MSDNTSLHGVKKFAAQFKVTVEEVKAKGTSVIHCDDLIAYLNEVENSPEPEPSHVDVERYRADLQNWIETNKKSHESQLEMFRSVITSGQGAIKSSFLMNGGASVAMLAFIGHLAQFKSDKVAEFAGCLVPFALGILAISMTAGFTYLTQWFGAEDRNWARKLALNLNFLCIFLGFASYGLFGWGIFEAYRLFLAYE